MIPAPLASRTGRETVEQQRRREQLLAPLKDGEPAELHHRRHRRGYALMKVELVGGTGRPGQR
eukprot:gene2254-2255_t